MTWRVVRGDCVEAMADLEDCSVDSVVCDPPYGLEFMGKDWDRLSDDAVAQSWDTRGRSMTGAPRRDPSSPGGRSGASVHRKDNPRCDNCGRAINGRATAKGFKVCECETPAPRLPTVSARKMQAWHEAWARAAFRVLKPGGHLLAFGGTRTYHRLAAGIEDAGFEIRDTISWMYGSGFPKSLDVSKAIDKQAGAEREVLSEGTPVKRMIPGADQNATGSWIKDNGREFVPTETAPATPEAERWQGWGTALKPAHEPIVVARKPLAGTVSQTVLEHGTGALNIDKCRVATQDDLNGGTYSGDARSANDGRTMDGGPFRNGLGEYEQPSGRWPANVVLSHTEGCVQVGVRKVKGNPPPRFDADAAGRAAFGLENKQPLEYGTETVGDWRCVPDCPVRLLDEQTGENQVSRFFYCSKAGREERSVGLENGQRSSHPTVKPVELMRWLVRLVTPPTTPEGTPGRVLDPFAGSGTTGIAAVLEGFDFIGVEREDEYADIAEARIRWWEKHWGDGLAAQVLAAGQARDGVAATGQGSLLDLLEDDAA